MKVGIPKEILANETKVSATPETVGKLVKGGMEVVVEAGAGAASYFKDEEYKAAGASIVDTAAAFGADLVLKVQRPIQNDKAGKHEVDMMKEGGVLISFLQPYANADLVKKLAARKVAAFSMELVPRISRAQMMDALSSLATVAGYKAVIMAADNLKRFFPMLSTAAGTIYPAKVVIIGAGVAGLQAIATAKRLGATVFGFDTRPAAGEQIKSLGGQFVPMDVDHSAAEDSGGYAKEMSADFYKQEQDIIRKHSKDADVIISTAQIPGKKAPMLITEEMVKEMKAGSVIVDLAVETGGNCAISELGKTVVKHDITIMGEVNIPSMIPINASQMYARNMLTFVQLLAPDKKNLAINFEDEIVKGTLVTNNGEIVHQGVKAAIKA